MTRKLLLALPLLLLPLLLVVAAWTLATSRASLPWIERFIEQRVGGLEIEQLDGNLLDDIHIAQLRVRAGGSTVTLHDIDTRVHWRCLLWGSVCIDRLHVQRVVIATSGAARPGASTALPALGLPLRLRWRDLAIGQMVFGEQDDAPQIDAITGDGSWAGKLLQANSLRGRYRHTNIDLSGSIVFDGDYPLDLRAQVADATLGVALTADIGGDIQRLIARAQIEQPLRAQARVALEPLTPQLAYRAQASLLTPYRVGDTQAPAITIDQGASVELHGDRHALQGTLQLAAAVRGLTERVEITAPLRFDIGQTLLTATPTLQSGNSRIDGDLRLTLGHTSTLAIRASGDNLDPAIWRKQYRGALSATADIELRWQPELLDIVVNSASANGMVNEQVLEASLAGNWHRYRGWKLARGSIRLADNDVRLRASGREQNATVELTARTSSGAIDLHCAISDLFAPTWRGHCAQLAWQPPQAWNIPRWRNRQPLQLSWQRETSRLTLAAFCVDGGNASLCSQGPTHWQPDDISAIFAVRAVDLGWAAHWLPTGYAAHGSASGTVTLRRDHGSTLHWSATANADNARALITRGNDVVEVPINTLRASIDSNQTRLQATATVDAGAFGTADAALTLTPADQINGRIDLRDAQFKVLQALLPDITVNSGTLRAQLQIGGTRSAPLVAGEVVLAEGVVTTHLVSTPLTAINLRLDIADTRARLQASAMLDRQRIDASGDFDLRAAPRGSLRITARELHLKPLPRTDLWISPDITLTLQDGAAVIDGTIAVPRGYIIVKQLPKSGVALSSDVSIVDAETSVEKTLPLSGKVNLLLGDDVSFRGFGLQTRLQGQLAITLRDNQLRGNGRIALLDGRYRAYGQLLDIRSGDLLFVGPLDNPVIRIDAIRPDVPAPNVVGIRAEGELRNPDIVLFSTPAMSERARMQYLLTGRAPESEADASGAIVGQALLAYGAGQSEGIVAGVADRFGVHDVSISTVGGENGTSVQVSARLSSRLYLRYGKNVFDNANEITMRYQLTRNLFVEAVSGVASALDLLWSFEFGR